MASGSRLPAYHDRLLLGLSGIMSEAELHQIRMRLHQGERQKAARGELRLPIPAGLAHDRSGAVILNPDEEVQARRRLVFAKFSELQSARAVMRYLRANGLPLPVRPLLGPAPHEIVWREADSPRVRNILQNPAYAGAYVYGRRRPDPSRRRPGSMRIATTRSPSPEWGCACKPPTPATSAGRSSWPTRSAWPTTSTATKRAIPAWPRQGSALLQGIATVQALRPPHEPALHRPERGLPVDRCRADRDHGGGPLCQEVRALPVDALVERLLLEALAPDRIAMAIAALGQIEEEARQLDKQWAPAGVCSMRDRACHVADRGDLTPHSRKAGMTSSNASCPKPTTAHPALRATASPAGQPQHDRPPATP